jgi:ubiquinone/menaquinone biosynthesis C-methylase UbiE/uncharacterized protein YbaR (Trm112 family)
MHPSFLPYLCDPMSGEDLQLVVHSKEGERVIEGTLISPSAKYPIVRGIPRFSSDGSTYADSFSYQWRKWSKLQFESSNRGTRMQGFTEEMWSKITARKDKDLRGTTIADVGCGSGRFVEIARMRGAKVIGMDLSSAVEQASENFKSDPEVLICQADALHLPLKSQSLDGVFSIGVLHHTPDPGAGFSEMARAIRPGGWTAVCVYGRGGFYDHPMVRTYRQIFRVLRPIFGNLPPLIYANLATYLVRPFCAIPLLGKIVRFMFPFSKVPDRRWCVLDTFDGVTPTYQSVHQSYEVFLWLKTAGLTHIEPSDWGFTAYSGEKPTVAQNSLQK